jgi:hypothetical protein
MKRAFGILFAVLFSGLLRAQETTVDCRVEFFHDDVLALHQELGDTSLKPEVLEYALRGYYNLLDKGMLDNPRMLTVIDFGLPSSCERMWVIDMQRKCVAWRRLVSHGMNSGALMATRFSNVQGSHQSSIGFYITADTFSDKKLDLCMRLKGIERTNSNAWMRGIIVHKAWYAEPEFLKQNGNVLGRSHGCPALPEEDYDAIVSRISGGSCFFIYHPNRVYLRWSWVLNLQGWLESGLHQALFNS